MKITEQNMKDKLTEYFPDKKKTTLQSYWSNYRKLCLDTFHKEPADMSQIEIDRAGEVAEVLKTYKPTCAKVYCNSLLKCLQCFYPETEKDVMKIYNKAFGELCQQCIKLSEYAKPTDAELRRLTTFEEIVKKREALASQLGNTYSQRHVKHLLLCLYTMFPPLRNQDWCNSKLFSRASRIKSDDLSKINYVCLSKKILVLNDYKTVKTHGVRIHKLPQDLINVLKSFKKISKSKWVIPHPDDIKKHMSAKHMSNYLNRLALCGCSHLRKLYISNRMDKGMNADQRKELACIMGHTCAMQAVTYTRYSSELHGPVI